MSPSRSEAVESDEVTTEGAEQGWPPPGSRSDLARLCRDICRAVVKLERAFQADQLPTVLASGGFAHVVGPRLMGAYANLARVRGGPRSKLRFNAVRALLAQFRNDLVATRVARAHVLPTPDDQAGIAEFRTFPFRQVAAAFDGAPSATLRLDQMMDARFWRIGFAFDSRETSDAFAGAVARSATGRLSGDLINLQRILERFNPDTLKGELKVVPFPRDRRFERLMLDVLNERRRHARVAPLLEDFREKTDLRVSYDDLQRRHGARVQVTSIVAEDRHEAKLRAIKQADEFVFLSPLSLAEFVRDLQGSVPAALRSADDESFELESLWGSLAAKPADVTELAGELRRVLFRALEAPSFSPVGPSSNVPLPVRQLIRGFVRTRAVASTERLRAREDRAALKRRRKDGVPPDEKAAEMLRSLTPGTRLSGRVGRVVDYGVFVDLGFGDGLLHINEIPGAENGRIREMFATGEEMEVEIATVDAGNGRVSVKLAAKQI